MEDAAVKSGTRHEMRDVPCCDGVVKKRPPGGNVGEEPLRDRGRGEWQHMRNEEQVGFERVRLVEGASAQIGGETTATPPEDRQQWSKG